MKLHEVHQWQFYQIFIQTQREQLGLEKLCQPCMVGGLCRGSMMALGQFSDGDVDPLDSACYRMLNIKYSPLLGEEKVSEGQKNELLKENLCMCHIFHNC